MSSVYATEPATEGRVIFETTHGPLDIHLWCRECPATTRFFLQLCLDGFYDNMLFHRIVPSLLIQTGAVRNIVTASPSADAWTEYRGIAQADQTLERRQYEVNARIQFNHRGQVAMAMTLSDNIDAIEMQPQFFVTTEDAPYLNGKHVIFGTLGAGPTIFNAIRICQSDVDEVTNTPADIELAPRILSAKILENPIHDTIVPQVNLPWRIQAQHPEKKKKQRNGKLDVNVLSFGDDMGDVASVATKGNKIIRDRIIAKRNRVGEHVAELSARPQVEATIELTVDESSRKESNDGAVDDIPEKADSKPGAYSVTKKAAADAIVPQTDTRNLHDRMAEDSDPLSKAVSLVEARRAKYGKRRKTKQQREEDTLAKILVFRGKIHKRTAPDADASAQRDDSLASRMARRAHRAEGNHEEPDVDEGLAYHGQVLESDDEGDNAWLKTRFKCRKHMDHLAGDGRDADEYQVIDDKKKHIDHGGESRHKKPSEHRNEDRKVHRNR